MTSLLAFKWNKSARCHALTLNQHFNGFENLNSTFFKVTRCERSIFCWILSEITVFAVTRWRDNNYRFFCIRNISKTKQISGKTHTEHCLTHLNKTAYEIWSVFDKVHFWVKILTPFFHRTLQLFYHLIWSPSLHVFKSLSGSSGKHFFT